MEKNNIFSVIRFVYLTKRYFVLNYRRQLIEVLAAIGFLAIIGGLAAPHVQESGHNTMVVWFFIIMVTGGFIITSSVFSELHKPEKSIQFLTLPSSTLEKYISGWFNTTVVHLVISLIAYHIAFILSMFLAKWWFSVDLEWPNLAEYGMWKLALSYIILQPIFLFGAIYFKGKNFFKTVFSLFALFLLFTIYHSIVGSSAMNEITTIFMEENSIDPKELISAPGLVEYAETTLQPVLKIVFKYIMPIFFITLGYISFKEREV